jgi:uncharacterized protein YndB with AHSA1/START domain
MTRLGALAIGILVLQAAEPTGHSIVELFTPEPTLVQRGDETREDSVRVTKPSDRETEVTGTFPVPPRVLFDAITRPEHLKHWMNAGGMTLEDVQVDPRAGGTFRYVFQRPNGRRIEVHGAYRSFDPPRGFSYLETYDFSPLRIEVSTTLEQAGGETRLTQTLRYGSTRERDEDFEPVSTSSREAYGNLARYLATRAP